LIGNWLAENYIEVLGVITSLIYLYFSVRQSVLLWPFGFLSSALFIYIFYFNHLYADMSLQVYYLLISIYGWYHWAKGTSKNNSDKLPVTRVKPVTAIALLIIFIVLWLSIAIILDHFTNSDVPWGDAFITAGSIIATWMLARKILEHWIIWILVDGVSVGLYLFKDMYPTVFLYFIYTVIAVYGFFHWKKDISIPAV
jgi:nicotinamide mononucleotide transporter